MGVVKAGPVLDKAEQSLASKESSMNVEKSKPAPPTEAEKELERVKDFNSPDEEVLRLMHPSIAPGEFWTLFPKFTGGARIGEGDRCCG